METIIGAPQTGGNGTDPVKDGDSASFVADVIEQSRSRPVLVDFWATWCAPCRQLTPLLEKLVRAARGRLALVKIDIDRNREIAAQLRIQSVPTVYAFVDGRPVDAFQGALPESQLRQFLDGILALAGDAGGEVEQVLAEARERLEAGEAKAALALYEAVNEADPESPDALGGIILCHLALGNPARARACLAEVPGHLLDKPAIEKARAALELAEDRAGNADIGALEKRLAANPEDHEARFSLAKALVAQGRKDEAAEALLHIIRVARDWNDGAARQYLLKVFEAAGPVDPFTLRWRRRLSALLFA